jgi:hypothetical protein
MPPKKNVPLFIGGPTNAASTEGKFICIMPCKEEEDEVKVPARRRGSKQITLIITSFGIISSEGSTTSGFILAIRGIGDSLPFLASQKLFASFGIAQASLALHSLIAKSRYPHGKPYAF